MKKFFVPLIAGALLITAALPFTVEARRGGGGGAMGGPCLQTGAQNRKPVAASGRIMSQRECNPGRFWT